LGATIGGFAWFLLAQLDVGGIGDWSPESLATAIGFTTVIVTFVLAWAARGAGRFHHRQVAPHPQPGCETSGAFPWPGFPLATESRSATS
jgi:hypothetical protein